MGAKMPIINGKYESLPSKRMRSLEEAAGDYSAPLCFFYRDNEKISDPDNEIYEDKE
jgi:hypothetical protein